MPKWAITTYRVPDKHATSWMTLNPDLPLQAHLWCPVAQLDAKVQHTLRLYRNHYTCSDDLEPARRGARRGAARPPGPPRVIVTLTTPRWSATPSRWETSRRSRWGSSSTFALVPRPTERCASSIVRFSGVQSLTGVVPRTGSRTSRLSSRTSRSSAPYSCFGVRSDSPLLPLCAT
jgi:hypothetical protein